MIHHFHQFHGIESHQFHEIFFSLKLDARDSVSIPGLGRSPGEENGNPLKYSCLENPMERGARWASVHGFAKSQTQLSGHSQDTEQNTALNALTILQ